MLYPSDLMSSHIFSDCSFIILRVKTQNNPSKTENTGVSATFNFQWMCYWTDWVNLDASIKMFQISQNRGVFKTAFTVASYSATDSIRINRLILRTCVCLGDEPNVRCVKPRTADVIGPLTLITFLSLSVTWKPIVTSISSILCSKELKQVTDVVLKGNWNSESIPMAVALVENVYSTN
jgi:hypothetical protein